MNAMCRVFRPVFVLAVLVCVLAASLPAENFRFKYQAGQQYRVVSQVFQDFAVDGVFIAKTDQLNRILVSVQKLEGKKAWHSIDYQNSLESKVLDAPYQYDRERNYKADFWRDDSGSYTIDPKFFVPTVRNVPLFPDRDLKTGELWAAPGYEVQDFRSYGLADPLVYSMPVNYTYAGKATWKNAEYDLINIDYNIFYRFAKLNSQMAYPLQVSGYSHQKMYWDNKLGRAAGYEEEYYIEMKFSNGKTVSWEGTANSRVEDIVPFKPDALQDVKDQVAKLNLPDVTVRQDDQGITLAIENIQFAADSANLLPSEKAKLDRISTILAQYPDRNLLVTGHTAQAGYAPGRQQLSEDRAKSVGQYLIDKKVRSRDALMFQGMGDRQPIADNDSEAGRARNRRVEITILTK
jgi:outer membrane protein OmpA-like peptidoglycan-associated protein